MKAESLIGETVVHKVFGEGVIKAAYDKYLEVEFPERKKQSKFSENFLYAFKDKFK